MNNYSREKCPFAVGETVVYRPSNQGRGLVVMTGLSALKPGTEYKIMRIQNDHIVVEGFENVSAD
jgi:hypothetical protein